MSYVIFTAVALLLVACGAYLGIQLVEHRANEILSRVHEGLNGRITQAKIEAKLEGYNQARDRYEKAIVELKDKNTELTLENHELRNGHTNEQHQTA